MASVVASLSFPPRPMLNRSCSLPSSSGRVVMWSISPVGFVGICSQQRRRRRRSSQIVGMAPDEEKMTRRSPLDFPILTLYVLYLEWERPKPGRRPDIFPQFSPMKTPLPPPLPADPPEEDEEEEEKKEEEEDPEKEDPDKPDE